MEVLPDKIKGIADIVVEHYQKTYELTYEFWKQRNRIFLILIGVIGIATLLTFSPREANSLLVDWIAKLLNVTDAERIEELHKSFPFGLLQSILLIVIFYLMVNLYHRALYVLRNYQYLGALEFEIRKYLSVQEDTVSFTRESSFYWKNRPLLLGTVKWVYIVLLGILLFTFLGGRVYGDFQTGNVLLAGADFVIAIPIIVYFIAYARSSVVMDTAKEILHINRSGQE